MRLDAQSVNDCVDEKDRASSKKNYIMTKKIRGCRDQSSCKEHAFQPQR